MPCGQPIPQVITSWRPLPLPCNDASTAPLTAGTRAPFAARRSLGGASAPGEMAAMAKWKENPWGNPWESYKKWRSSWKNHWKNGWIVQVMFDCRINGGFLILAAKLQNQERLEVPSHGHAADKKCNNPWLGGLTGGSPRPWNPKMSMMNNKKRD